MISSHHFAARSAENLHSTPNCGEAGLFTGNRPGYLQPGLKRTILYMWEGEPVNDFGAENVRALTRSTQRIKHQIKDEALIPAWG